MVGCDSGSLDASNVHRKLIGKLGYESHNSLICFFAVSCKQWGGCWFDIALERELFSNGEGTCSFLYLKDLLLDRYVALETESHNSLLLHRIRLLLRVRFSVFE